MGELGQDLTFLNWTAYFQNAFDRINHSISNETEVVVYGSRYLQGLSELIWEYQNTTQGRRTLDSYMKWHVIKFARSALSEPYRDAGKILVTKYLLFCFVLFFQMPGLSKRNIFQKN